MTATQIRFSRSPGTASIRMMPTMVEAVFTLPDLPAAMTRPCSTATRRRPVTANSRARTMKKAQPGIQPTSTNQAMAEITRSLSARGSMNLPKSVIRLYLRAT